MEPRIAYAKVAPGILTAMGALTRYERGTGLEQSLLELVKVRASQLNRCAFCLDLHVKDALALGERDERLHMLAAWRDSGLFTPRERAALAWAEAVTLVADSHVPDDVYEEARHHFSEKELADLTLSVAAINAWNRLEVSFRTPAGRYVSKYARKMPAAPTSAP